MEYFTITPLSPLVKTSWSLPIFEFLTRRDGLPRALETKKATPPRRLSVYYRNACPHGKRILSTRQTHPVHRLKAFPPQRSRQLAIGWMIRGYAVSGFCAVVVTAFVRSTRSRRRILTCGEIGIATSPFIRRDMTISTPEKLGNLQCGNSFPGGGKAGRI